MARPKFKRIRTLFMFMLAIAFAWALQRWADSEETIVVDGRQAAVIDGDSFKIGTDEFRIYGIDAPEYRQICNDAANEPWACGKTARGGLDMLMKGKEFNCDLYVRDQFGRAVVSCADEKGLDLGAAMVTQGLAISGDNFDDVIYADEERLAEKAKRGIWQGSFDKPANWRAAHPR
ncbi:thermonuclease family protein [Parasphingorhabdus halotolerans]|uniref:Thermonuclease family protein n=1 Tax=Parasphingorhabdus halotolerans TaxID=2725558 RepID=A0A6H2DNL1_9SPHN|nr:thermonuclease family protein [Parasphingorhabdus halotolerans]QJB69246.1 thermonuclease family protein [Parasphingorhabdus halotolerans]